MIRTQRSLRPATPRRAEHASLGEFLATIEAGPPTEPLLLEFVPRHADAQATFREMRKYSTGARDTQYVTHLGLEPSDLIEGGLDLQRSIYAASALVPRFGSWISWPDMITEFHRDWNLWSTLNFMFHGHKTWYLLDERHVTPHHANLVLSNTTELVKAIEVGRHGYKIEQKPNQCVYLPDGYYHRVMTTSFSLNYSIWWTWLARLARRKSILDVWWFERLARNNKLLKSDRARDVATALSRCGKLETAYCRYLHGRFLALCNRCYAQQIRDFMTESDAAASRMQKYFSFSSLAKAQHTADKSRHGHSDAREYAELGRP